VAKYSATIKLFIDDFEAESREDADNKINDYLNSLSETNDTSLTWGGCDWEIEE